MRTEVKDFARQCERLISMAMQTRELSDEECGVVAYYAKELYETASPYCSGKDDWESTWSSVSSR